MEKKKGRDNFSQAVLKILFRRAGGKCCKCGAVTFGPVKNRPQQSVNIGKGAHIAAAAPGGPRYDPKMSAAERASASNGMWLCSNCHDTIDRDEATYTTPMLKQMKKDAEERIRKELGVATVTTSDQSRELVVGVSAAAILEIRRAKTKFLDEGPDKDAAEYTLAQVAFLDFEQDEYTAEVAEEMVFLLREVALQCKDEVIALEVIRSLKAIAERFHSQWEAEQVGVVCQLVRTAMEKKYKRRSKPYQSGLAFLKDLSSYKSLKERRLSKVPLDTLKALRGGRDEPDVGEPAAKRFRGADEEEEQEDKYHELMEQLASCTDNEQIMALEEEIQSLGFEPLVQ